MTHPLRRLGNGIPVSNPEPAPLPFAWGVLYRGPNPDRSRKLCENCIMWVRGEEACLIHERAVEVPANFVCGFHVFGAPMENWMDHPGIDPVKPELSGLRLAGSGVSCANCRYFVPENGAEKGVCRAVAKDDRQPPQPVDGLGWCARYEGMSIGG